MLTWPHWIRHSVPPALKCSLVSSFAHKIPSVCAAVATSTVQRCTLQPTIWTQAPYHPSCRLVYNYANHLSIIILMCILLYTYLLTGTNTGGGNVDFWCATNHVPVPTTPWTVCIQRTCDQPATGCSLFC